MSGGHLVRTGAEAETTPNQTAKIFFAGIL